MGTSDKTHLNGLGRKIAYTYDDTNSTVSGDWRFCLWSSISGNVMNLSLDATITTKKPSDSAGFGVLTKTFNGTLVFYEKDKLPVTQ